MLSFFNKILRKISSQNAQHISEYSLLMVCVMAGILIGGPYVVRSWNALLKSYDTDMLDSFTDPLKQAPPTEAVFCDCEDWKDGECGASYGNILTCPRLERLQYRSCTPFQCTLDVARCEPDPTCCKWENVTCEGVIAGVIDCTSQGMLQKKDCEGDGTYEYQCDPLNPMCLGCEVGPGLPAYTDDEKYKEEICPGDYINVLPAQKLPFWRVDACDPDPNIKCQVLCNAGNGYVASKPTADGHFQTCECRPGTYPECTGSGAGYQCVCADCNVLTRADSVCRETATGSSTSFCNKEGKGPDGWYHVSTTAVCPAGTTLVQAYCAFIMYPHDSHEFFDDGFDVAIEHQGPVPAGWECFGKIYDRHESASNGQAVTMAAIVKCSQGTTCSSGGVSQPFLNRNSNPAYPMLGGPNSGACYCGARRSNPDPKCVPTCAFDIEWATPIEDRTDLPLVP